MKMNTHKFYSSMKAILVASLCFASVQLAQAKDQATGTITSMDLQSRTMEIDKQPFTLADKMVVFSPQSELSSQAALSVGQKIDYWSSTGKDSTKKIITKIQIKTLFDDKIKR